MIRIKDGSKLTGMEMNKERVLRMSINFPRPVLATKSREIFEKREKKC